MGDLLGFAPDLPYADRLQGLTAAGIALWDVIAGCERSGSLDADIVRTSVRANDFAGFLAAHPGIERVFFNGAAAETNFRRHVLPQATAIHCRLLRLPSTSPAHAARGYAEKLAAWSVDRRQIKRQGQRIIDVLLFLAANQWPTTSNPS